MSSAPAYRLRGWSRQERLIVFTLFMALFFVFGGGYNTAGVFFDPVLHQFGWSRARLSSLQTVLGLSAGISAPIVGWILDAAESRFVISSGAVLAGAGLLVAARAHTFLAMAVAYSMLGVGIAAASLLPCSQVLANWFGDRRGTALGLAMAGTSVGGMAMSMVAAQAIARWGWRIGYVAVAAPILLITLPAVLIVVRKHPDGAAADSSAGIELSGMEVKEALKSRSFWMIAGAQLCFSFAVTGASIHMVPYLIQIGKSPEGGALVLSATFGLASIGKPIAGAVADLIGGRLALALVMVVAAAGELLLLGAASLPILIAFTVLFGLASGAPLALVPDLIAESLGLRRFGTLTGLSGIFLTIGAATGPLAAGFMFDSAKNYVSSFIMFAIVLVAGAFAALGCIPTDAAALADNL